MSESSSPSAVARHVAQERSSGERLQIRDRPPGSTVLQVLGVTYLYIKTEEDGDLYLTTDGAQHLRQLLPQNWYESEWFRSQRQRLDGTAAVYRTRTKRERGEQLELVVKFNRVGSDVPGGGDDLEEVLGWEFNGPFEEFGLVQELRHAGASNAGARTQVPLAIYLPPDRVQPWRTGRSQWRMARKMAQHPGVALDILRRYVVVYQWMLGIDAWEAQQRQLIEERDAFALTARVADDLAAIGYRVLDNKPQHVIVDPEKLASASPPPLEEIDYGLVDFELLERTQEQERAIESRRREAYERQRAVLLGRQKQGTPPDLTGHLSSVEIFGAPYIVGRTESTGGKLWVVGHEPDSFDLFLPERWRTTPQIRLWENHQSFLTTSKDNLRIVWKVSRVGARPEIAAFGREGFRMLSHGFNSPFEEVAIALWLLDHGIGAILPRAIYRTGHRSQLDDALFDPSRYHSHQHLRSADGEGVLERRRNYISLWDCCSGQTLGEGEPRPVMRSLNCAEAMQLGLISAADTTQLLGALRERMLAADVEPLRLLPSHVIVLRDTEGGLVREQGTIVTRVCNFLYLRWSPGGGVEAGVQ